MKATLTFNLPDEEWEHETAVNAPKVCAALGSFTMWMRQRHKYEPLHSIANDELGIVRDKFSELVGPYLAE